MTGAPAPAAAAEGEKKEGGLGRTLRRVLSFGRDEGAQHKKELEKEQAREKAEKEKADKEAAPASATSAAHSTNDVASSAPASSTEAVAGEKKEKKEKKEKPGMFDKMKDLVSPRHDPNETEEQRKEREAREKSEKEEKKKLKAERKAKEKADKEAAHQAAHPEGHKDEKKDSGIFGKLKGLVLPKPPSGSESDASKGHDSPKEHKEKEHKEKEHKEGGALDRFMGFFGGSSKKGDDKAHSVSAPQSAASVTPAYISRARGLFDYQAQEDNEISFKKGEIIMVMLKHESGWWQGELNGKIGVFPSNGWIEELPLEAPSAPAPAAAAATSGASAEDRALLQQRAKEAEEAAKKEAELAREREEAAAKDRAEKERLAEIAREREKGRDAEQAREREAIAKEKAAYAAEAAQKEKEARAFVEAITGVQLKEDTEDALRSGVLLCNMLNTLKPGSVQKIDQSNQAFKQPENVGFYVQACKALGIKDEFLFVTADLFDGKNMTQVIKNILAVKRQLAPAGVDAASSHPAAAVVPHETDARTVSTMIGAPPPAFDAPPPPAAPVEHTPEPAQTHETAPVQAAPAPEQSASRTLAPLTVTETEEEVTITALPPPQVVTHASSANLVPTTSSSSLNNNATAAAAAAAAASTAAAAAGPVEGDYAFWNTKTYAEVKKECERRGIKILGGKEQLIKALLKQS